ncbi:unnamed protein product [Acanthoscelides obtectus]|uniref:Carboxylic ester hydrolase n=1 Tax=Acanthoscelides obtectus TaxID=200917 RepID=A0A9P0NYM7_ACAOB|nr:unnamed protein product [Acanthoscelides obtectus]CAK1661891.1 hypothetical protein AOBTE_LOCUS22861 [Acanthoscelides obtectus]
MISIKSLPFYLTLINHVLDYGNCVIITTPLGKINGTTTTSRLGRTIYSFRGIRYAEPPIGELRFQPPKPKSPWKDVYDATEDGPVCPQPTESPQSEDCLILNVYTTKLPEANRNPKRPVIVYIHAGGFYSVGSSSVWTGPNYYLDQDIVLVTVNYRLATLGFLSTGTKEAPGNNGMKDQVEALKWIKKNIASFGGDPDSVTIQGYSAGGFSAILHMISPMSQGLFHKAVAMSGSPLGPFPTGRNQLQLAKKQSGIVGCPNVTISEMITCLKSVPYQKLGNSLPQFFEFGNNPILIWYPVIEDDFGQERFLTEHPMRSIMAGKFQKLPLITGITEFEFGYRAYDVLRNSTLLNELNSNFEETAPTAFTLGGVTEHNNVISRALKKFYFNNEAISQSKLENLSNLFADSVIGFGVNRAAKLVSQKSDKPVYYYKFNFKGRYSHFHLPNSNETIGAVHHDDLLYLFYAGIYPEVEMVSTLTTIYANFAKSGNPIPADNPNFKGVHWEPYTVRKNNYLDIGHNLTEKTNLYENRYREWEKLYPLDQ